MINRGYQEMRTGDLPKVHTRIVWLGDKGNLPHQFKLPPFVYKLDGVGYAFTCINRRVFFLTNEAYLLRIDTATKQTAVCPAAAPEGGSFVGITSLKGTPYALLRDGSSTFVVVLSQVGHIQKHFQLELPKEPEAGGITPPVWFAISPSKTILTFSFNSDIFDDKAIPSHLREFHPTGSLKRVWDGVTGVALDDRGTLYVSGSPKVTEGLNVLLPPRELDPEVWRLVGVDKYRRFYWHRNDHNRSSEAKNGITTGWIACSTVDRRLQWQIKLTGTEGVLAKHDPELEVYLGWGGHWLQVSSEGILYILADSHRKIKDGVGIYSIELIDY